MSMPGMPQGRGGEIGETIASFPTYEGAQKAVSALISSDVPARDIAIVGSGLRSVERVTGKLGYATAARQGAINGLLLGLFFSAIFVLGNSAVPVSVFIGVLFIGVALGMLMSIAAYAIVRRRRDFASVMQVVADHYDVTVLPTSIHRAREILGPGVTVTRPPTPPQHDRAPHPAPRYGLRARPAPPEADQTPAPDVDEPPRYGERIPDASSAPEDAGAAPPAEPADAEPADADGPTDESAADGRNEDRS
jgi:hypothetical protein